MKRLLFVCIAVAAAAGLCSCSGGGSGGSSGGAAQGFVSYDANRATGGKAPAEQSGDVGTIVVVFGNTGNLQRTGYVFDGWNGKSDGTGTPWAVGTKITLSEGVLVLYAKWTAKPDDPVQPVKYTVSFYADNGTTAYAAVEVESGAAIGTLPAAPTKTGYSFDGWWTGQNGGGTAVTSATVVHGAMSAYAKWTADSTPPAVQCTVTYSADGGQSTYATATVDQGSSAGSLPSAPAKTGYTFSGWWTGLNGGGTEYTATTTVSADVAVYAYWIPKTYTISYDLAGGVNSPLNPATYTIETTVITLASPTKTGNDFLGWYSDNSYANQVTAIPEGSTGNISLFAKWKAKSGLSVTVSIPAGGGISFSPAAPVCAVGEILTVTATAGFASYAWYVDGTLLAGETASSVSLDSGNDYGPGAFELMLVVTDAGGNISSGSCRIHFEN